MKNEFYTLEQASRATGYIITVGKLDEIGNQFEEMASSDGDYMKLTKHETVDNMMSYLYDRVGGTATFDRLIEEKRVAAAPGIEDDVVNEYGFVSVDEMNKAVSGREYEPFIAEIGFLPKDDGESYAYVNLNYLNITNLKSHYPIGTDDLGDHYARTFGTKQEALKWINELTVGVKVTDYVDGNDYVSDIPEPVEDTSMDASDNDKEFGEG